MGGGFYNANGPRTLLDNQGYHPLGAWLTGGLEIVNATIASGVAAEILGISGSAFRLHRFVCPDVIGTSGGVTLLGNTNTFFSSLASASPSDDLDGQIVEGQILNVFNGTPVSVRITLTYDVLFADIEIG